MCTCRNQSRISLSSFVKPVHYQITQLVPSKWPGARSCNYKLLVSILASEVSPKDYTHYKKNVCLILKTINDIHHVCTWRYLSLVTSLNYIMDEEENTETSSHLPIGWITIL